ncbi:MAG: cytochrome c-550 PedF [Pseudomonadota bacterium]
MRLSQTLFGIAVCFTPQFAFPHGDAAPQAVDTTGLPELSEEMATANPWRDAAGELLFTAVDIGAKGYNSNCARCHGLEVVSGGLAPDLRFLEADEWGDEWYLSRVLKGYEQNGAVKMPPFEGILSQEAIWAIRLYIETRPDDQEILTRQDELRAARDAVAALDQTAPQPDEVIALLEAVGASFEAMSGAPRSVTVLDEAAFILRSDSSRVVPALDVIQGGLRD